MKASNQIHDRQRRNRDQGYRGQNSYAIQATGKNWWNPND